jgi:protein disulfide-isomerase A1
LKICFAYNETLLAANFTMKDNIVEVLPDQFQDFKISFPHIIYNFYSTYCHVSEGFGPIFEKLAERVKAEKLDLVFARTDIVKHDAIGRFEMIRKFPTLKYFLNGNPVEYDGALNETDLYNWLRKKIIPNAFEIFSLKDFEKIVKNNDRNVVVFWGNETSLRWPAFHVCSQTIYTAKYYFTNLTSIKKKYDVVDGIDSVTLFRRFSRGVVDFEGEMNDGKLVNFVKGYEAPSVRLMDYQMIQDISKDTVPVLVLIIYDNEQGRKAQNTFETMAPLLEDNYIMAVCYADVGYGRSFAPWANAYEKDIPAFRVLQPLGQGHPHKFIYKGPIDHEAMLDFIGDFHEKRLKPWVKSEPVPIEQTGPVTKVVGENFQHMVVNNKKDVLVMFYASWAATMPHFDAEYHFAAEKLKRTRDLLIVKVDATLNDVAGVDIKGYPHLKFYAANRKDFPPVDYTGDMNANGIVVWLKEHTKAAKWLADDL